MNYLLISIIKGIKINLQFEKEAKWLLNSSRLILCGTILSFSLVIASPDISFLILFIYLMEDLSIVTFPSEST